MRYACRPVDETFLDGAPLRFVNTVEVGMPAAAIFALFEDEAAWPRWWRGMREVTWTSPRPFGAGTTRIVRFDMGALDEHFFRWEPGRRFSFYIKAHSVPLFRALAEDYLVEQLGPDRARFTYTVAIDPGALLRVGGPMSRWILRRMFAQAAAGLVAFAKEQGGGSLA